MTKERKEIKETKLWHSLLVFAFLLGSLTWTIVFLGQSPHVPLFASGMFAATIAIYFLNYTWEELQESIFESIKISLIAVLILITVGMLIGTWMISGVVPSMIYYGMLIINPQYFLISALLLCSIAALGTGSSWSTMATVGVALMGISEGLGIPAEMTAGAVISGAYFGDKLSPLSDTSNLSCACVGSDLIQHIKHMQWSSVPTYLICIVAFLILGFRVAPSGDGDLASINSILSTINGAFTLSPFFLLVPVGVIGMVLFQVPAVPGMFIGALAGGILAVGIQGAPVGDVLSVMLDGFVLETGHEFVDSLLSRGGMNGMMSTVLMIMCAMTLGGILEKTGMVDVITQKILSVAKSVGDMTAAVVFSCVFVNAVAPEQYLSLILPGNMFAQAYRDRGIHPVNLSRTLQDAGVVTSALIPWNTCGAFLMAALGVAPWVYVPYAFFNILSPLMSILYGYMGWTMLPYNPDEDPRIKKA